MDSNTTTPVTFGFFPQLPLELQLSIWEAAIDNEPPRNIVIRPLDGIQYLRNDHGNYYETRCRRGVPALLHVNRESRGVASKTYRLHFSAIDDRPQYFDLNRDVLHLVNIPEDLISFFTTMGQTAYDGLVPVRNLAINSRFFVTRHFRPLFERMMAYHLSHFTNLQTITFPDWTTKFADFGTGAVEEHERYIRGLIDRIWKQIVNPLHKSLEGSITNQPQVIFLNPAEVEEWVTNIDEDTYPN
jgi:hypothetical protein